MTYLAAESVMEGCGYSVLLRWCGQSSRDLTVYGLTGRNWGPNPQYFALGNRFHSSGTYRRKSVTMVPGFKEKKGGAQTMRSTCGIVGLLDYFTYGALITLSWRCKKKKMCEV